MLHVPLCSLIQKNSLRQDLVEFLVSVDQNLALTVTTSRSAAQLKVLARAEWAFWDR